MSIFRKVQDSKFAMIFTGSFVPSSSRSLQIRKVPQVNVLSVECNTGHPLLSLFKPTNSSVARFVSRSGSVHTVLTDRTRSKIESTIAQRIMIAVVTILVRWSFKNHASHLDTDTLTTNDITSYRVITSSSRRPLGEPSDLGYNWIVFNIYKRVLILRQWYLFVIAMFIMKDGIQRFRPALAQITRPTTMRFSFPWGSTLGTGYFGTRHKDIIHRAIEYSKHLIAVACFSGVVYAQGVSISGQVISPAPPAGTGGPAAFATVRVCPITALGTPCSPLTANIYADSGLTVPIANPTTTDLYGNFSFFVPTSNYFLVQVGATPTITYSYSYSSGGFPSLPLNSVQYNCANLFCGSSNLTWISGTNTLNVLNETITGIATAPTPAAQTNTTQLATAASLQLPANIPTNALFGGVNGNCEYNTLGTWGASPCITIDKANQNVVITGDTNLHNAYNRNVPANSMGTTGILRITGEYHVDAYNSGAGGNIVCFYAFGNQNVGTDIWNTSAEVGSVVDYVMTVKNVNATNVQNVHVSRVSNIGGGGSQALIQEDDTALTVDTTAQRQVQVGCTMNSATTSSVTYKGIVVEYF